VGGMDNGEVSQFKIGIICGAFLLLASGILGYVLSFILDNYHIPSNNLLSVVFVILSYWVIYFLIIGFIISFVLGKYGEKHYTIGYIVGDFLMVILFIFSNNFQFVLNMSIVGVFCFLGIIISYFANN
jgi:hypothetical protein